MSIWRQLFTRRMLICVFTGFASGLPLYLLLNLLPAWLRTEHMISSHGVSALIQFPLHLEIPLAPFAGPLRPANAGDAARLDAASPKPGCCW